MKGMYKSHKGSMSSNWEDHVEQQHSDLVEVAPGLFQVSASYYSIPKYRNMTVLQLPGGGVLVHSPIALPEATMQAIEELGKPRFLFVPNESGSAHIDLSVYQQRYPESKTICPAVIAESMKKHVNVDGIAENALKEVDSGFLFITPHMKQMQGPFFSILAYLFAFKSQPSLATKQRRTGRSSLSQLPNSASLPQ